MVGTFHRGFVRQLQPHEETVLRGVDTSVASIDPSRRNTEDITADGCEEYVAAYALTDDNTPVTATTTATGAATGTGAGAGGSSQGKRNSGGGGSGGSGRSGGGVDGGHVYEEVEHDGAQAADGTSTQQGGCDHVRWRNELLLQLHWPCWPHNTQTHSMSKHATHTQSTSTREP